MTEAIAAFSLAANVVQFIDIGSKLASKAWEYHHSDKASGELSELQRITEDLQGVSQDLQPARDAHSSDEGLPGLACRCHSTATGLLTLLAEIVPVGQPRKRDSLRAAFRMVFKKEEIQGLRTTLNEFRQELTLHLLVSLRSQSQKSLEQQELVLRQLAEARQGATKLEGILDQAATEGRGVGDLLLNFITSKLDPQGRANEKQHLQHDLIEVIYHGQDKNYEDTPIHLVSASHRKDVQSTLINQLQYPGMNDREGRIPRAHEDTFHWIFKDQSGEEKKWSNFKEWLESDSPLYWITGKPGSGKSTLMKFICSDDRPAFSWRTTSRCHKHLRKWAKHSDLIIATFFLWNSGADLQMSRRGLLLSLLYQILHNCPGLIPSVAPRRWEAMCLFSTDAPEWTEQELQITLQRCASNLGSERKLCLFVDGLDEFDGDLHDLLAMFMELIQSPNVKLCAASRPWVEIEDAFMHSPSLMLQDLTYSDIKRYITSTFGDDSRFALLRRREPEYADELIENIISKACGVFLWVHLVVASLLAGIYYGDRVVDLQRRLEILPPDLENLYDKIMRSLDPFYLEHAAQLFKLVQESRTPPSLLRLSFADEETPESAIQREVRGMSQEQFADQTDTMRRRLNSRCKGLLEVGLPPDPYREAWTENESTDLLDLSSQDDLMELRDAARAEDPSYVTVQYLHKTVKEYIERSDVQETFQAAMKTDFDPNVQLCVGALAELKSLGDHRDYVSDGSFWACIHEALRRATLIRLSHRAAVVPLLDELDRACSLKIKQWTDHAKNGAADHPSRLPSAKIKPFDYIFPQLEAGNWVPSLAPLDSGADLLYVFGFTFPSLVVRYGIVEYVEARVNQGCLVQRVEIFSTHSPRARSESDPLRAPRWDLPIIIWPLLCDTVFPTRTVTAFRHLEPCPEMVACLLAKGADPRFVPPRNLDTTRHSALVQTLKSIITDGRETEALSNKRIESARMMLDRVGGMTENDIFSAVGSRVLDSGSQPWHNPGYKALVTLFSTQQSWSLWLGWPF